MRACKVCNGTHQHLYRNGDRWVHAECHVPEPHWPNPYKVIYVPIEALAECHMGLGQPCGDVDGSTFILTKERILEHWRGRERKNAKLDAYILPQPSGWHDIGIRYGAEDHEYLSPAGDKEKVAALLKRYL